jgi:cell division protein YceG involved in septum cleavage
VVARGFITRGGGLFLPMLLLLAAAVTLSADGQVGMREVTFVVHPGERVCDLADRWQRLGISSRSAVEAVAGSKDFAHFPLVPPPRSEESRFEGLFRPGSYTIWLPEQSAGDTAENYRYRTTMLLISSLLAQSAPVYEQVLPQHGMSAYQLLILASIVQKEAAAGTDYRLVASVFFNRLAQNIELGSCPTLEYALGYHRPFLTWYDLKLDSPYNTYRHRGLPPTPIAFFCREALAAVQHPVRSDYLFFVFDWTTGQLFFARSFREHQQQARLAEWKYIHRYDLAALHRKHPGIFYQ